MALELSANKTFAILVVGAIMLLVHVMPYSSLINNCGDPSGVVCNIVTSYGTVMFQPVIGDSITIGLFASMALIIIALISIAKNITSPIAKAMAMGIGAVILFAGFNVVPEETIPSNPVTNTLLALKHLDLGNNALAENNTPTLQEQIPIPQDEPPQQIELPETSPPQEPVINVPTEQPQEETPPIVTEPEPTPIPEPAHQTPVPEQPTQEPETQTPEDEPEVDDDIDDGTEDLIHDMFRLGAGSATQVAFSVPQKGQGYLYANMVGTIVWIDGGGPVLVTNEQIPISTSIGLGGATDVISFGINPEDEHPVLMAGEVYIITFENTSNQNVNIRIDMDAVFVQPS